MLEKLGVEFKTGILSNNIRFDIYSKKNAPIEIRFNVLGGDIYNGDLNKKGLTHFMEHVFCAGTKEYPSKDKLALHLDSFGGYFGGETWCDKLILKMGCPDNGDLKEMLRILKSALDEPLLTDETIETERGSIISELNIKLSNNNSKVYRQFVESLFVGTEYEHEVLGTLETINTLGKNDFESWIKNNLVGGKIGVCITGDIDLQDIDLLLEEYLGFIPKSEVSRVKLPVENVNVLKFNDTNDNNIRFVELNEKNSFLMLAFKSVGLHGKDYLILNILNSILGERRSNILTKKLRYETGLVYSPKSYFRRFYDMGYLTIEINCKFEDVNKVVEIINKIISEDFEKELTEERFRLEQNRFNKTLASQYEKNSEFLNFGNFDTLTTYETNFDKYVEERNNISYTDFLKVGKNFLKNKNWYISYYAKTKIEIIDIEK